MILSYIDIFDEKKKKHRIKAEISFIHSSCSYGMPAIVLEDGGALGLMSWVSLGYKVIRANKTELKALVKMGFIDA